MKDIMRQLSYLTEGPGAGGMGQCQPLCSYGLHRLMLHYRAYDARTARLATAFATAERRHGEKARGRTEGGWHPLGTHARAEDDRLWMRRCRTVSRRLNVVAAAIIAACSERAGWTSATPAELTELSGFAPPLLRWNAAGAPRKDEG